MNKIIDEFCRGRHLKRIGFKACPNQPNLFCSVRISLFEILIYFLQIHEIVLHCIDTTNKRIQRISEFVGNGSIHQDMEFLFRLSIVVQDFMWNVNYLYDLPFLFALWLNVFHLDVGIRKFRSLLSLIEQLQIQNKNFIFDLSRVHAENLPKRVNGLILLAFEDLWRWVARFIVVMGVVRLNELKIQDLLRSKRWLSAYVVYPMYHLLEDLVGEIYDALF